ncbi:MAG: hypothetical protein HUU49_01145 [Candidatus Buchananbacteria bacterium]|nr:hypothetical protein [Candidatus Buchananbacteria bacterium]
MIVQCCVCKKIHLKNWWIRFPQWFVRKIFGGDISHGYCPKCAAKAYAKLDEYRATTKT